MKNIVGGIVLAGSLGLFGLMTNAEAVVYTNELPVGIWDISGSYDEDLGLDESFEFTINQDGKGKFSGYGSATVSEDDIDLFMDFIIKGKIKSKNGVYYVDQKLIIKGMATDGFNTAKFSASTSVKAEIDTLNKYLDGTVKVKVSIAGYSESYEEPFYEPLDEASMDGSAVVYTDIDEVNGKIEGVSEVHLSNGRIIYFDVNAKEIGDSMLKLIAKGDKLDPDSKGSKMVLDIDALGDVLKSRGKISGQNITWDAAE